MGDAQSVLPALAMGSSPGSGRLTATRHSSSARTTTSHIPGATPTMRVPSYGPKCCKTSWRTPAAPRSTRLNSTSSKPPSEAMSKTTGVNIGTSTWNAPGSFKLSSAGSAGPEGGGGPPSRSATPKAMSAATATAAPMPYSQTRARGRAADA